MKRCIFLLCFLFFLSALSAQSLLYTIDPESTSGFQNPAVAGGIYKIESSVTALSEYNLQLKTNEYNNKAVLFNAAFGVPKYKSAFGLRYYYFNSPNSFSKLRSSIGISHAFVFGINTNAFVSLGFRINGLLYNKNKIIDPISQLPITAFNTIVPTIKADVDLGIALRSEKTLLQFGVQHINQPTIKLNSAYSLILARQISALWVQKCNLYNEQLFLKPGIQVLNPQQLNFGFANPILHIDFLGNYIGGGVYFYNSTLVKNNQRYHLDLGIEYKNVSIKTSAYFSRYTSVSFITNQSFEILNPAFFQVSLDYRIRNKNSNE